MLLIISVHLCWTYNLMADQGIIYLVEYPVTKCYANFQIAIHTCGKLHRSFVCTGTICNLYKRQRSEASKLLHKIWNLKKLFPLGFDHKNYDILTETKFIAFKFALPNIFPAAIKLQAWAYVQSSLKAWLYRHVADWFDETFKQAVWSMNEACRQEEW